MSLAALTAMLRIGVTLLVPRNLRPTGKAMSIPLEMAADNA
jgi:hypothetical protein